jgi:hypothetical protein
MASAESPTTGSSSIRYSPSRARTVGVNSLSTMGCR